MGRKTTFLTNIRNLKICGQQKLFRIIDLKHIQILRVCHRGIAVEGGAEITGVVMGNGGKLAETGVFTEVHM